VKGDGNGNGICLQRQRRRNNVVDVGLPDMIADDDK